MSNGTSDGSSLALTTTLQVLGAAAGLTALATLVGGATLWIRFDELRLPADQAVALMPERLLLIIGVHALAAPVLIGLVVLVLLVLAAPLDRDGSANWRFWVAVPLILLLGFLLIREGVAGLDLKYKLVMYPILAFGILVIALGGASSKTRRRHIALIVFAAFSVAGAALAIVRTAGRPQLEPAAVLLEGDKGISGFYVGQTGDRLYIATLASEGDPADPFADAPVDRVIEIARDEVVRLATRRPTRVGPDGPGRDQAQTLLFDLRLGRLTQKQRAAPPAAIDTRTPVADFAPLANLHSKEEFWPMSAEDFITNSSLFWAHGKGCAWSVALERHVKRPNGESGRTRGIQEEALGGKRSAPYVHPAGSGDCRDRRRGSFRSNEYTRPFEKRRPKNLPKHEGFYMDLSNGERNGTVRREKRGSQVLVDEIPVYWERHPEGRSRERITYWFFFALSRPPGPEGILRHFVHEGDWERVSVLVERRAANSYAPISVRYHFHDENRDVPWNAVRVASAEDGGPLTHPVVYIARASHASYPRAGEYEEERTILGDERVTAFDEAIACPKCPQWRSWDELVEATEQPWYGFGGAWGAVGRDGGRTGPLGPSSRKSRDVDDPAS